MGKATGAGRVNADTRWANTGDYTWIQASAVLVNFDIDGTKLKPAHTKFLDQVATALGLFPDAKVLLIGSASKSGPHDHNFDLSQQRGDAVKDYLVSKRVSLGQFAPPNALAAGDSVSRFKLDEDELDRAVFLSVTFLLTISETWLYADNHWDSSLKWNDIVGMDDASGHAIDRINIQVRAWGAPRAWTLDDGTKIPVMPKEIRAKLSTKLATGWQGSVTIPTPLTWNVPLRELPNDLTRDPFEPTYYRLSRPITDAGRFVGHGRVPEFATIGPSASRSIAALKSSLNWSSRGDAELPASVNLSDGDEYHESPDAKRLFQAGGVEILVVEAIGKAQDKGNKKTVKRLIRSAADLIYFDGDGREDGCLMIGKDCYITPQDVLDHWKVKDFDTEVVIFGVSSLLSVTYPPLTIASLRNGTTGPPTGPALEWAKLLRTKGGPLIAILGYADDAPRGIVLVEVVKQMAAKINAGLQQEQWARAWLDINAAHRGKNTWNAVAMDLQGWWWIYERSWMEKHVTNPSSIFSDTPQTEISGPAPIP